MKKIIKKEVIFLSIIIFLIGIIEIKGDLPEPPCINDIDCILNEGCYPPKYPCTSDSQCISCGSETYAMILSVYPAAQRITQCFDPTPSGPTGDNFCQVKFLGAGYGPSWIDCYTCSSQPGGPGWCGYEEDPCMSNQINNQDDCCNGYTCRYYESQNYYGRCCTNGLETENLCGINATGQYACLSDGSFACCSPEGNQDCVIMNTTNYEVGCYEDDNDPQTIEYYNAYTETGYNNVTCSLKHWCSVGFVWNPTSNRCEQIMCGNNQIDPGEQCDGTNLNNKDCTNYIPNSPYTGGTLSCNEDCTFNTQGCLTCGVEATPCPNDPINSQYPIGSCCSNIQQSPGFKCRYYEFESVTYPYAKKCCENNKETERMCAQYAYTPQQGLFLITTCTSSSNDVACCYDPTNNQDCVYDNKCYPDDLDYSRADITVEGVELVCTSKHWCPVDFVWNPLYGPNGACTPVEEPCGLGLLPNYCPYDILLSTTNYLVTDQCFNPLPEYLQSCCYDFSFGVIDIYNWEGIKIYDTSGNLVSSGGGAT